MSEDTKVEEVKKKRINSKAKGSGFENHISKVFSDTLPPMKFRRSQSSGAILGGMNAKNMASFSDEAKALFVGDVVPTNESDVLRDQGWKLRFSIECKFYKTADNIDHLFGNTKIIGWFKQASEDAAKVGKEPLLIFKFNRTDTFCAIDPFQTSLPKNISRTIDIEYNRNQADDLKRMIIMPFKEVLADVNWFKVTQDPTALFEEQLRLQRQMQQNNVNNIPTSIYERQESKSAAEATEEHVRLPEDPS